MATNQQTATMPQVDAIEIERLTGAVRGAVIQPTDANYDAARAVHNAMIDKKAGNCGALCQRCGCDPVCQFRPR